MKKVVLACLFFVVAVGILCGCTNERNVEQTNELKKQIKELSIENNDLKNKVEDQKKSLEELSDLSSVIVSKDIENYPQSLYKKTNLDIDQDGENEVIELYVNAEKLENGLFAWDDGQMWLLVVKDGNETYPLFNDYVQLGSIDFSTIIFEGEPGIVMLETWHSDNYIHTFTYDSASKGFVKDTFYKKENINQQYNLPASYAFFQDAYELMEQAFTDKAVKALEANTSDLQERGIRAALIDPIYTDLAKAQSLFETVEQLNPDLYISLESALNMLNQMVKDPPTVEQMNKLMSISNVFMEKSEDDRILNEENQIQQNIKNKLKKMESILSGT